MFIADFPDITPGATFAEDTPDVVFPTKVTPTEATPTTKPVNTSVVKCMIEKCQKMAEYECETKEEDLRHKLCDNCSFEDQNGVLMCQLCDTPMHYLKKNTIRNTDTIPNKATTTTTSVPIPSSTTQNYLAENSEIEKIYIPNKEYIRKRKKITFTKEELDAWAENDSDSDYEDEANSKNIKLPNKPGTSLLKRSQRIAKRTKE